MNFVFRTHSPNLNRAALTGTRALDQMADDFRVMAATAGSVDREMLRTLGWLPAQIDKFGEAAADRARAISEEQRRASERNRKKAGRHLFRLRARHQIAMKAPRFSEAQQRTIDAIRQNGYLLLGRVNWETPDGVFVAHPATVNALIAGGFCKTKLVRLVLAADFKRTLQGQR